MWRSYLASALGNLARNRLYAAINIAGLAIGMAAALLLALYIRNELSFDRFFPGYRDVYLLTGSETSPRHPDPIRLDVSLPFVAPILKLESPEIETVARVIAQHSAPLLKRGRIEMYETGFLWADPDVFQVLPFKAIAGDPRTALETPDSVVLTRSAARRYFGRDAPLGETLFVTSTKGLVLESGGANAFNTPQPMRVTAVIEDLPATSSLKGEVFAAGTAPSSILTLYGKTASNDDPWQVEGCYTFVRLAPGAPAEAVRRRLPEFVARHVPPARVGGLSFKLDLTPIAGLHLSPPALDDAFDVFSGAQGGIRPRGDPKVIVALAAIATLIMLSASTNFVALASAQASRRALETGMRKVVGAQRGDLIVQFIGEALTHVAAAMVCAVVLAELLLPSVNAFLGRRIGFDYLHDPALLAALIGATLVLGVLAGFYPALVLSAFRPAAVLKGGPAQSRRGGAARRALVTLQFALMIGLMITAATLWRQTVFTLRDRLRVDGSRVLVLETGCLASSGLSAFRDLVGAQPGVEAEARSSAMAFDDEGGLFRVSVTGGRTADLIRAPVGFGYFELYGLKPLAGRFLVDGRGADGSSGEAQAPANPSVMINETALRTLGFRSAAEAVGKVVTWKGRPARPAPAPDDPDHRTMTTSQIVGVAPDFTIDARHAVRPRFFYYDPNNMCLLHVRLDGRRIPETLAAIDKAWADTGHGMIHRRFLDQTLQAMYADVIVQSTAIGVGAGLALVIAALGLLGLAAHAAESRTKEIGVRKAMGASTADIVKLLLWQFSRPVLIANLIAWPAAWWAMHRWLAGFAYHVDLPVWLFLAAGGTALLIACATVLTHALLVARASPVTALRYE